MIERKISQKEIEIENLIKPILETDGFYLVECCFIDGKNSLIRLYVYNKDNTSVEKLSILNKKLYPVLSGLPFTRDDFSLEVSSPGLYRKFKCVEEFKIFQGRNIKVTTSDGKTISGVNEGIANNDVVIIDKQNTKNIFNIKNISNASLDG